MSVDGPKRRLRAVLLFRRSRGKSGHAANGPEMALLTQPGHRRCFLIGAEIAKKPARPCPTGLFASLFGSPVVKRFFALTSCVRP
jgi:hypothetical protein